MLESFSATLYSLYCLTNYYSHLVPSLLSSKFESFSFYVLKVSLLPVDALNSSFHPYFSFSVFFHSAWRCLLSAFILFSCAFLYWILLINSYFFIFAFNGLLSNSRSSSCSLRIDCLWGRHEHIRTSLPRVSWKRASCSLEATLDSVHLKESALLRSWCSKASALD